MTTAAPPKQILVRPVDGRFTVRAGGDLLADSDSVLELVEEGYPPVLYFPRDDVAMTLLTPLADQTFCPHKGHAVALAPVSPAGDRGPIGWSYEAPYPSVDAIAGHVAFYPARVTITRA